MAVKIEPISANDGCTRLWKSEIQFDGIFEGYSEFLIIPSCRFVSIPAADEINNAKLLTSEYSSQPIWHQK